MSIYQKLEGQDMEGQWSLSPATTTIANNII